MSGDLRHLLGDVAEVIPAPPAHHDYLPDPVHGPGSMVLPAADHCAGVGRHQCPPIGSMIDSDRRQRRHAVHRSEPGLQPGQKDHCQDD